MTTTPPVDRTARFDSTGRYRYRLTRSWDRSLPIVSWIMLNPATATADRDDPTIRRVIGFSRSWGFGGADVVNLFAYRTPHPAMLGDQGDPVGPDNDRAIASSVPPRRQVVVAWGNHGRIENPSTGVARSEEVRTLLRNMAGQATALGITKRNEPKHPLYVPAGTRATPFHP